MPAKFFSRFFAFILDGLILGVFGWILAIFLKPQFISMGGYGRFVGLGIAILYFTILNSHLGHGQTIGKRATGIRVVDAAGTELSVLRSFIRASILCSAYFLNGVELNLFPLTPFHIFVLVLLFVIVFGFGLGILYFIIFDRPGHRSLHDIIAGSVVIKRDTVATPLPALSRRVTAGYAALILAIVALAIYFNVRGFSTPGLDTSLNRVMAISNSYPHVSSAHLALSNERLFITLRSDIPAAEFKKTLPGLLTLYNTPAMKDINLETCTFAVLHGFDIGISRLTETHRIPCKDVREKAK